MNMLSLLEDNHGLPLFNMDKRFIWLEETKECINKFSIRCTINSRLNIKKSFREQVHKCMINFVQALNSLLEPHKKIRVLPLLMFYETRQNPRKYFKVLSYFIYKIISNYVCIEYLAFESIRLGELPVGTEGVLNIETKVLTKYWELQ